jgi:hypothetical protein
MKTPNKTKVLLGIAIVCTLVAGGLYTFFFISMKNKTDEAVALSAELSELSGAQLRYASAGAVLKGEQENINKLTAYFIKESEIVAFTKKIEALGQNAGVTLSIESLDPGVTPAGAPLLSFNIIAEGKFENTQRLLSLLQNLPGKFEWRTVRFAREGTIAPDGISTLSSGGAAKWKVEAGLVALNFVRE